MTTGESADMVEDIGGFMKQCASMTAQQQLGISQASLRLGYTSLSRKWLLKAMASMDDLYVPKCKSEAKIASYILSVMAGGAVPPEEEKRPSHYSLYEGALLSFSDRYHRNPRLYLQFGMAVLRKAMLLDALQIFKQGLPLCNLPDPPHYSDEVLHALDAQIIVEMKQGNMAEATQAMGTRLDIVTKWSGNSNLEVANGMRRLACFHSLRGHHEESAKLVAESIHVGYDYDDYNVLDSFKLVATALDAKNDTDRSKLEYEGALSNEEDPIKKAKILNALANLHLKAGGQSDDAVDCLEKSLEIQGDDDAELKFDTMILYGNAKASQSDVAQAIYWYESALNSNPDKSTAHPSNLRALYNKGVTLFRSGDTIGAGHAFGLILDEVETNSAVAPGTCFVLNAIGSIYFANKDYAGACEQYTKSLSCKNSDLSPCQRAMTLCNIGTAYYKMRNNEESEKHFKRALLGLKSEDEECQDIKVAIATIMCKFACILYKRKLYLRAYNMFTEGKILK